MHNHLRSHRILMFALLLCGAGALFFGLNWRAGAAAQSDQPGQASPDGVWQGIGTRQAEGLKTSARAFRLNPAALTTVLERAPLEFTAAAKNAPTLALPLPDGTFERFSIEESPIFEPALAASFPEIKAYRVQGVDDPTATGRLNWSPQGFYAFVLRGADALVIQLAKTGDLTTYVSYTSQDQPADTEQLRCLVQAKDQTNQARILAPEAPAASVGGTLRVYRLAVATTVEYTNQANLGGGTVAGSLASIAIWLSGVNAIMEKEVAVRLVLVGNNNLVVFTAEPDGLTNGDQGVMIDEVPNILSNTIGVNNYDIGHAFGATASGGGGIAGLGVLCSNFDFGNGPQKGAGATRFAGPSGQSGQLGVIAHEFGHQFGADHTFNAQEASGNCAAANRSGATAYETGSGSTLMSYGGICMTNNLSGKEFRLHAGSFAQIIPVLTNATCNMGAWIATGNNVPTINAGGNFTIPRLTPFQLTATGNDADAADLLNLTYTWDQIDAGGALYPNPPYGDQPGDPNTTTRPLFRSYPASSNPARLFPSLTYILNNANVPPATTGGLITGENPPSVSRTMNFRATIRDNRANGGGVNEATAVITVDGNAGPFNVTSPNGGNNILGGAGTNVTWNVAGTSGAPINATNVKISLSTDGGNTFPTVLAASTPNDGTQSITFPNGTLTTLARLKIEAVGNIFFDISDANFSIAPGDTCPAVSGINPGIANVGNQVVLTGVNFTGVTAVNFTSANVTCPSANCTINSNMQITLTVPAGALTGPLTLVKSGCTNLLTANLIICPNPPATLQVDDGSFESVGTIGGTGTTSYYVNRLTPAAYPATLSQVSVYFADFQSPPVGTPINILVGTNTDGDGNIDGTTFQTVATTVMGQDTFTNYLVIPVTINSGDFVVGYSIVNGAGFFAAAHDTTTPNSRSYRSTSSSAFGAAITTFDLLIRAVVFTGNCSGPPPACPTVNNINPTNGAVGSMVTITGTNFTGVTAVKFSNNVTATFTINSATQITATVPTGAVTGPITISKTGCADVNTGTFTVPLPCHTVNNINPTTGLVGAQVFITGANFTGVTGVKFSNNVTATFTVTSATQITATVPAGAVTGPITISRTNCADVQTATFTVATPGNGLQFYPLPQPVRLLETRPQFTGCTNPGMPINANGTLTLPARTVCAGIPANAAAVTGNVTVVPQGPGFLTLFPSTATQPTVANSNFLTGEITNNVFTVGLGAGDGAFKIFASATTDVIVDVTGYYAPPGTGGLYFHPLPSPVRLLETRPSLGGCITPGTPLVGTGNPNADPNLDLLLQGRSPITAPCNTIPAAAQVLVGNATSVFPSGSGYLTIYPSGGARPLVASSNYAGNDVINGPFAVKLGADGKFKIYTLRTTHLVVDILGYYSTEANDANGAGLLFNPLPSPVRLLETRPDFPGFPLPGCTRTNAKIVGNLAMATHTQMAANFCGVPAVAQAVVGNVTVVNSAGAGFLTLFPGNLATAPLVATSNYPAPATFGYNRHYFVGLSPTNGTFKILTQATTDLVIDVSGYFAP
jgi:hypothetical protein